MLVTGDMLLTQGPSARRWCITLNNPWAWLEDEDINALKYCTYFIAASEEGDLKHTHHLQCYAEFSAPVRMTALRKVLGDGHFEVSNGTPLQASDYCKKSDPSYDEWGTLSKGQGSRTDIIRLRDATKSGATNRELIDDDDLVNTFAKFPKFVQLIREAYKIPCTQIDRADIDVEFWFGSTGTGKSRTAREEFPEAYWKDQTSWWNGYTGQTTVIWDEFMGCCCTPTEFNLVCDKYPHQVRPLFGWVPLEATKIIIISNYLPHMWWKETTRVNIPALIRRFHKCRLFEETPEHYKVTTYGMWEDFYKVVSINRLPTY